MKFKVSIAVFTLPFLAMILLSQTTASAAEPAWYPYVVARGADRIAIQNMPMHQRPYRPMHIYGNAVRRGYHRGYSPQFNRGNAPLLARSLSILPRR